ncbi:MAG: class I SAM-dependent methyltransferase [Nitriliruptoraceae bacterium]
MTELDVETARWLTSAAGRSAVTSATRQLDDGADELAVAGGLRTVSAHAERRAAVLEAAATRRRARQRWPGADDLLFTREALEQASDPRLAAHRAGRLLAGLGDRPGTAGTVVDLCAGIGGDAIALARAATGQGVRVLAVDTDAARLTLLAHNAEVAGVEVSTREADALTVELPAGSVLHADPSRRRGGRRVRRLSEHVPSVPALLAAHPDAVAWALALAPGVDVDDPELPGDIEVEYVQLGRALVEATVWIASTTAGGAGTGGSSVTTTRNAGRATNPATAPNAGRAANPATAPNAGRAANPATARNAGRTGTAGLLTDRIPDSQRRARATLLTDDEVAGTRVGVPASRVRLPVGGIGHFLIEVAPAAVRARLHDELGRELGARRLSAHRALLTCDTEPPAAPWYRARAVLAELPSRPRAVRRWLQDHEAATGTAPAVELVLHGVRADPEQLWRELGRPRRGPQGLRLEFIRRDHDSITVVTGPSPS